MPCIAHITALLAPFLALFSPSSSLPFFTRGFSTSSRVSSHSPMSLSAYSLTLRLCCSNADAALVAAVAATSGNRRVQRQAAADDRRQAGMLQSGCNIGSTQVHGDCASDKVRHMCSHAHASASAFLTRDLLSLICCSRRPCCLATTTTRVTGNGRRGLQAPCATAAEGTTSSFGVSFSCSCSSCRNDSSSSDR